MNNNAINNVFEKKDVIIKRTKEYQQLETKSNLDDYAIQRNNIYEYFDSNFSDDEIMVIQSIMYFGRECFAGSGEDYKGTMYDVIFDWMENLGFSFGKNIDKNIEINQMVEKKLKIGTYFELGFKELEGRS